jgi:hypothetical protein
LTRPGAFAVVLLLAAGCHRPTSGPTIQPDASQGRVVSLNRRPLPGSQVRIGGCADQVTAPDGSFDTSCAATPYDLAVTIGNVGIVYQGLTRRDPVVTIPVEVSSDGWCPVYGTVSGRTEGREAGVSITSTAAASPVTGLGATPNGFFSSDVLWLDASPSATVRGLEWTGSLNGPTAFTAYGAVRVPLEAGKDATGSPVLAPIGSGTLSIPLEAGQADAPDLWVEWPEGETSRLPTGWSGAPVLAVPTPEVPEASFTVVLTRTEYGSSSSGYTSAWRRRLPATATLEPFALPAAAAFVAPPAEALVDLSTDFSYTAVPGAVYLLALESGVRSNPQYYAVTSATTARVPDFTWAGLPSPRWSGAIYYTASVSALGPLGSVDAAAEGPLPVEPDAWAWQRPFAFWPPPGDGFATRHRMTVQVWQP